MFLSRAMFVAVLLSSSICNGKETQFNDKSNKTAGFQLGNGTFLLNGDPIRLYAGSLQHFRIHPQHWQHRLTLARAMGLNAVQTLIPWMMMEPTPGEFVTAGFLDIVKFLQLAQETNLLVVLRPGPFICDGPDYGGFPWWLTQNNPQEGTSSNLRVRTADTAFLNRVDLFFGKLFSMLREANLTADLGGPVIMAQIDNEYGLFGADPQYLAHLRDFWRQGLGNGVVIHSTDPASPRVLAGSRLQGVLQTVDFGFGDPAQYFATLRESQRLVSQKPQPQMVSEIYPGYLTYIGGNQFPIAYDPNKFANFLDTILDTEHCGGNTSFALWLFAACTDFGFWGGTLWGYQSSTLTLLTPTYDFGAPVDEAGKIRPLFFLLRDVLKKHGAIIPSSPLPPAPPVYAYGQVVMNQTISLWDALQVLQPSPVVSPTVKTMEELGQGYGYILYSTQIPSFDTVGAVNVDIGGIRDRALVYFNHSLYQTCSRGNTVDTTVCTSPTPSARGKNLDILVENQGRPTGGYIDVELTFRGISRHVALNGQLLGNWTIYPLPLNNTDSLKPIWKQQKGGIRQPASASYPTFYRGSLTIAEGKLGDTFLTLLGWQKGQAWVNGFNIARYWSIGPQFSFYCPAGFLKEGVNEVLLLETSGAPQNLTVEFKDAHTIVGPPSPTPQQCPQGWSAHAPGFWQNTWPHCEGSGPCHQDNVNITTGACANKCNLTKGCLAFEIFQPEPKACYLFIDALQTPFSPDPDCFVCVKGAT
eukprot:m.38438 g.38438  ORF g.38438 m.38438 type:complete len:754 (+) comp9436_c0_seq1:413-2674(+)